MKTISSSLQSHLEGETTTLSLCWRITKRNGVLILGTDHDQDIIIRDGDLAGTYSAKSNILPSNVKSNADLAVDNMDVVGAVGQGTTLFLDVTVDDIESRNLDFAGVKTFFVNWADPDAGQVPMRSGFLGAITYDSSGQYKTEIRGLSQKLQQNIIQTYSDKCTVIRFGDTRCGFDVDSFTIDVQAASVTSRRALTVSGLTVQPTGYFTGGNLTCVTGLNAGVLRQVRVDTDGALQLYEAFPEDVAIGDTFRLSPGCDRLSTTCLNKFDNLANFRGYGLLIPGIDALMSGVTSTAKKVGRGDSGGAVGPVAPLSPEPIPPDPTPPPSGAYASMGLGVAIAPFQLTIGADSGAFSYAGGTGTITGNYSAGGIPGGHTGLLGGRSPAVTGPACPGAGSLILRYTWRELEPTRGSYVFTRTDAEIAQALALGITVFVMIETRKFDGSNPAPDYLASYKKSGPGGVVQIFRWNLDTVAPRWAALVNAYCARYAGVAAFAGIGTQETSVGGIDLSGTGYTAALYLTALKAEHDAIALVSDKPHLAFQNFMSDTTVAAGDRKLDEYAAYIQKDKAILAGPDLVRSGTVNSRCYARAVAYHAGGTTPSGVVFASTGPTGQSIQHSEWSGAVGPGPTPIPETVLDLFKIGTGVIAGTPYSQHCDYLWYDFNQSTTPNGENFTNAAVPLFAAHPAPIGTWTP